MARRFGLIIGGRSTQPCIANEARRQMALMRSSSARLLPEGRKNKCRMNRGGKGVARSATSGDACLSKNQPFYVKFLNR